MELFFTILILLALVGVSNILSGKFPLVPVPLMQIALGIIIAAIPSGLHMHLEPELFFVLFIAPLLYNDGKHVSRAELWKLRVPILLLAVGLVFATVFLIGYAIHWMIPSIPLPVAFGLAAILSPTDAVAVGSLAGRIRLPNSLMHLLEGEALMNDASGLVAFKFAIAAALTGSFSLANASVSFLFIAIGGLAVGAVTALLVSGIRVWLRRSGLEDETMHMLIHLLTPFALYMIAEQLGVSGILAAVAGGVVHAIERDRMSSIKPLSNELSDNTWSVIVFILNGLVFVILGLQLPSVFNEVFQEPTLNNGEVIAYAVIIFLMLLVLRFLWALAFSRGGRWIGKKTATNVKVSFRKLAMTALSGVRGAVTLAGAFSIPLLLDNGAPFPERSLVIFLSAVVILLSLIAASALLPLFAQQPAQNRAAELAAAERKGERLIMGAAIRAVHSATTEDNEVESASVISDYERWRRNPELDLRRMQHGKYDLEERELRLKAIDEERRTVNKLLREDRITETQAVLFQSNLEQMSMVLSVRTNLFKLLVKFWLRELKAMLTKQESRFKAIRDLSPADREAIRGVKVQTCEAALSSLRTERTCDARAAVMSQYEHMLAKLTSPYSFGKPPAGDEEVRRDLQWIAIQAERDEVQSLFERNEITRDVANKLRRTIRTREATLLSEALD
ncbi:monovalent cation:H+ antiporter, CPA1 family [Cohnella sp. OV330]|uniref:Na+/H+ antiporter n=1 Tax=Cohnella sp. OV330 TaxID=1855288 RepID=UPI0008E17621|nr:Na+/H+ antiporter [Cohnella sp. OV330]SFB51879.1 monovalent cation:H+ antiporter, CPA1 family [Cohnella sp. OV330]